MRSLISLLAVSVLGACQAPASAPEAAGEGSNVISIPDSSSGNPSGDVAEPAPAAAPMEGRPAETAPPVEATAIPSIFQGKYDESRAACHRASPYRLVITPSELRFHESIGKVRSVSIAGPRVAQVVADYEGEGQTWRNSRELRLSHDDVMIMISGDGTGVTRVRCP